MSAGGMEQDWIRAIVAEANVSAAAFKNNLEAARDTGSAIDDRIRSLLISRENLLEMKRLADCWAFLRFEGVGFKKALDELEVTEGNLGVKHKKSSLKEGGRAPVLLIDTETTGVGSDDEPISIALVLAEVDVDSGGINKIRCEYHGFREPGRAISRGAQMVHGISAGQLKGLKFDIQLLSSLFLYSKYYIAHNAKFDKRMIENIYDMTSFKGIWRCSCFNVRWPSAIGSKKLDAICSFFNISCGDRHDALNDVRAMIASLSCVDQKGAFFMRQLLK